MKNEERLLGVNSYTVLNWQCSSHQETLAIMMRRRIHQEDEGVSCKPAQQ